MAEILTKLVEPAMEELGKGMVATIKRQFNYLCCFNSNIQNLKDEAQKLDNARGGLQMQVDTDRRNAKDIVPEVTAWLDASNEIEVEKSGIEAEIKDVKSSCFAIKSRYLLSRKAKKTAEAIKVHREGCKFEQICASAPPASMAPIPTGTIYEFETRKQMENEIMKALMGRKVDVMGICGMGGVGKTSIAKKIMNRVREENLFNEVVMVVVSQDVDMLKIQRDIAEFMGLRLEEGSLSARAKRIHDRIMQTKRFLLILDDVWGRLKLEELGVPCGSDLPEGCIIFITSRSRDVLSEMDAKIFAMEVLSETEAWSLFSEKVGTCIDEPDLLSIAKEVVEECKGLPLALVTVGRALKDKRKHNWECALEQLKSANPIDIPHVLAEVYNPIKLSYDFLDNQRASSLFLLCCLFPEDHDIHVEYLIWYGMGLGMFEDIRNLEKARDRVQMLLGTLKSSFLLLDGSDDNYVKMHDVVRDVAIFIASSEGFLNPTIDYSREQSINCEWISVSGRGTDLEALPIPLTCPSLRLLVLSYLQISDPGFFKGMKELNVLSFHGIILRSIPQTIDLLQKLRTLYLVRCRSLATISIVGKLLSLEILVCHECHNLQELSADIGSLNRLKLLEISKCRRLRRIVPGVISSLVRLEDLKIVESFRGWETKGKEKQGNNASIGELEFLVNLTSLEIEIEDTSLAAEEINFPLKMVNFYVQLTKRRWVEGFTFWNHRKRMMRLELEKKIALGKWVQLFLRSTENLCVSGDGSKHLDLAQAQSMKILTYTDCSTVKKLTTSMGRSNGGVFPLLESLYLRELPNLEEICDGPIPKASNSFGNLKKLTLSALPELLHLWEGPHQNVSLCNLSSLKLESCDKLRSILPLAMVKDGLLQLKELEISHCEMIEKVFTNEENEKHLTFPKLEKLRLIELPRLTTFCEGSESIAFPVLHSISIEGCPKLTSLVSSTRDNPNSEGHEGDSIHVFCNEKVSFGSMKEVSIGTSSSNIWCHQVSVGFLSQIEELSISKCNGIRSLFSSSVAKNLSNLKSLNICYCEEMETMVEDEETLREKTLQFSSLRRLELTGLPKLKSLLRSTSDLDFSSLETITIEDCPLLEFPTPGSVSFGSLKKINIKTNSGNISWCHQISIGFFSQLEELSISGCNGIRSLFSSSVAKKFSNLKSLKIDGCQELETIIEDEEMLREKTLQFSNLRLLQLIGLSKLKSFVRSTSDLDFSSLQTISIFNCPLLEFLTAGSVIAGSLKGMYLTDCGNIFQFPLNFFNQLELLQISGFQGIKSLFSFEPKIGENLFSCSIAANLVNLEYLTIENCNEMVKVIEDEWEESLQLFPSLKQLVFYSLPKLQCFGHKCDLHMPYLESVWIEECPSLEFLTMGSVSTPNLESIYIDVSVKDVRDLNGAIRLHYEAKQEKCEEVKEEDNAVESRSS